LIRWRGTEAAARQSGPGEVARDESKEGGGRGKVRAQSPQGRAARPWQPACEAGEAPKAEKLMHPNRAFGAGSDDIVAAIEEVKQ
jgi:hypothetical protein